MTTPPDSPKEQEEANQRSRTMSKEITIHGLVNPPKQGA